MCLCLNGWSPNPFERYTYRSFRCDYLRFVCSRRATINCHNIAIGSFVHLIKFICSIKSWLTFVFVCICFFPSFVCCLFVISLYFQSRSQKNCVKFDISQVTFYFVHTKTTATMEITQKRRERKREMRKQMLAEKKQ